MLLLSLAFQTSNLRNSDPILAKAEALQATLSSLPHQVVNEAYLKLEELEGKATFRQKLDVLKEQEELIQDELEQDAAIEARKREKEVEERERAEAVAMENGQKDREAEIPDQVEEILTNEEKKRLITALEATSLNELKRRLEELREERTDYKEVAGLCL